MTDANTNKSLKWCRMVDFVREVAAHKDGVTPKRLKRIATREEGMARQAARKLGLVRYMDARWSITSKGKVWIEQPEFSS